MGLQDWIYGRTDKQRAKRAEKIRQEFGSDPDLTPAMLEVLTKTNDMPNEPKVALYKEAVPAGIEPTRVSVGYQDEEGIHQVAVLFPGGLMDPQPEARKTEEWGAASDRWGAGAVLGNPVR